ncbi:hypothetical protein pEaSNUABM54_00008 [Erwinia phage pEa_SNUABM_54]|nr:hypothetical protein pEaSNUABM54_00008 [Erwinia phage pEa_SNUABM_54]
MSQYTDLYSPDYKTATVDSEDPNPESDLVVLNSPVNVAPSHFIFGGLGPSGNDTAELRLQIGEFQKGGFNGIPPESLLLALAKHYEGLQESSIASPEYRMVVNLLNDCIGSLKGRNDIRQYYGKYGTIESN